MQFRDRCVYEIAKLRHSEIRDRAHAFKNNEESQVTSDASGNRPRPDWSDPSADSLLTHFWPWRSVMRSGEMIVTERNPSQPSAVGNATSETIQTMKKRNEFRSTTNQRAFPDCGVVIDENSS
jgi:hypothetical protein